MMLTMQKILIMIVFSFFISACGGGGDEKATNNTDNNTGNNPGTVTNTAPNLAVSTAAITMNETESATFTVVASDKEDANFTLSVVSDNPSLTVLHNGDVVTLLAGEVSTQTVVKVTSKVTDSGGLTKALTTVVTILNVEPPVVINNAPVMTLSITELVIKEKTKLAFNVTATDIEDGDLSENITVSSSNPSLLTLTKQGSSISVDAKEVTEDTNVNISVSVTDSEGLSVTKTVLVTVTNYIDANNLQPTIALANMDENNSIYIFERTENIIPVVITDADSANVTWSINSIEGKESDDAVIDYIESITQSGDNIIFNAKQLPENTQIDFRLVLSVTDGNSIIDQEFTLKMVNLSNSDPLFTVQARVAGFVPIPMGETKTFSYTIIDDHPEDVVVDDIKLWFGDETKFTATFNHENKTITITDLGLELGEDFGLLLSYTDKFNKGLTGINVRGSVVFGDLQVETLQYVQEMYSKMEALNEYKYLANFYAEVLENLNYISESQKNEFIQKSKIDDSTSFSTLRVLVSTLESQVVFGTGDGQDPVWINDYKGAIDHQFGLSQSDYGKQNYNLINDMSDISQGLLPHIGYVSTTFEYDTINKKYSKFAGNTDYGTYENGAFIFNQEFDFLNAILAKALAAERQAFSYK
ncbi:hypothetical protein [Shewanella sp. SG44-2]|uniref:hypothetical protein n=1 Tax=Shewanella sp. SG44-2 TaxID=2760962 RepID=UPI001C720A54|nr:hypothetical protein [Shewanella sp. SG44-2]